MASTVGGHGIPSLDITPSQTKSVKAILTMSPLTLMPTSLLTFMASSSPAFYCCRAQIIVGSGIALFGSANSTFNVVVDNNLRASVNGTPAPLLYSDYNLTQGLHSGESSLWKILPLTSSHHWSNFLNSDTKRPPFKFQLFPGRF
jgi:hypothetical protein